MKKIVAMLTLLTMLASLIPASLAEEASYIAAPYAVDEAHAGPSEYLVPVFYENADGPTIGVTLVGVIQQDGLYFKDSDNDQELDAFEDWRLSTEDRAADLLGKMTLDQRGGLLVHQLMISPNANSAEEAKDENGNVIFSQLLNVSTGDVYDNVSGDVNHEFNTTGIMLAYENRSGVIRKDTDTELGALYNNALNMVTEYDAVVKGEPTIPFVILSNPMTTGFPGTLGMAAAAMGDGNYDVIERYADLDRQIWNAKGIRSMYGPQIDLVTDPRWSRNATTFTEVPEVAAGIATALVTGYQQGTDGAQDGDVALIMKHFPGDGAAENGFESHYYSGQWRIYATEGSLEKYQLVAFQAAIDAGLTGMMPGYSRPTQDGRSAKQSYRGVEIDAPELANAYNPVILGTLLKDAMGFKGLVNSDSNIITSEFFGAEQLSLPERYAAAVEAGVDVIGDGLSIELSGGVDYPSVFEAVNDNLIDQAAFDRATTNRLTAMMNMGMFENPYRDSEQSKAVGDALADDITAIKAETNHKSIVLMKNHENALPLSDTSKKVFVQSFTVNGADDSKTESLTTAFAAAGFTVVEDEEEADIAFLDVAPGGVSAGVAYMNVIDLVDGLEVDERGGMESQAKTGETTEVVTLQDVKKISKIAEAVHANGGIVVAAINITSPWILTNLEPHCDALLGVFSTSVDAQMDVLTGTYNPSGRLPITMVSCNEVIAVTEQEIDGVTYEICVSPNDVPGYDKDQYIAEDVLAQSPSGSYAYKDADGNVYAARFGLSY